MSEGGGGVARQMEKGGGHGLFTSDISCGGWESVLFF